MLPDDLRIRQEALDADDTARLPDPSERHWPAEECWWMDHRPVINGKRVSPCLAEWIAEQALAESEERS